MSSTWLSLAWSFDPWSSTQCSRTLLSIHRQMMQVRILSGISLLGITWCTLSNNKARHPCGVRSIYQISHCQDRCRVASWIYCRGSRWWNLAYPRKQVGTFEGTSRKGMYAFTFVVYLVWLTWLPPRHLRRRRSKMNRNLNRVERITLC